MEKPQCCGQFVLMMHEVRVFVGAPYRTTVQESQLFDIAIVQGRRVELWSDETRYRRIRCSFA